MKQLILFPLEPEPVVLPDLDSCTYVHFKSIDPEANRFRFYTITWQKTLWGEWTIRTTWGRVGGVGRSQVTYFDGEQALREALPGLVARRIGRGYAPLGGAGTRGRQTASPVDNLVHELVTLQPSVHIDKCTA